MTALLGVAVVAEAVEAAEVEVNNEQRIDKRRSFMFRSERSLTIWEGLDF